MATEASEPELDEDGLTIQRYDSNVLFVLPPEGYGDQILRYARSSLYNVAIGSRAVTCSEDHMAKGRLQDEVLADGSLDGETMASYCGIVICGCEGANPLATDERVAKLLREAHADGKLIGTWGNGLEALTRAGVVKGRKVTGAAEAADAARKAGARFTGRQLEAAGHVVTALDEGSGMRFGQALVAAARS
jgi:putative intracellular protease/amidase